MSLNDSVKKVHLYIEPRVNTNYLVTSIVRSLGQPLRDTYTPDALGRKLIAVDEPESPALGEVVNCTGDRVLRGL
jgi:hypothetical protein